MTPSRIKKLKLISARLSEQLEYLDQVHSEEDRLSDNLDNALDLASISFDLERVIYRLDKLISLFACPF